MPLPSLILPPLLAFALTAGLYALALRFFPRLGLLDFPGRYGLSRPRIPYPTGIIAIGSFLIAFLTVEPLDQGRIGLLIGVILLGFFCFLDDRRPLPPLSRIVVQIAVALILFATGARIYSLTNPLAGIIGGEVIPLDTHTLTLPFFGPLSVIGAVFTVLWLGLTINALNWFDGIPGQVSLLSMIAFLTIGFLSLSSRVDDPALARLAFILAGIGAATFLFDIPPPRMLIGDSGAMLFGLLIGTLTVFSGKGKVATAFLVLGVPLTDSIIVSVRRLMRGRSPLRGSQHGEHLHHRLLERGWSERQVIALTAGIGTMFGMTALFLSTVQKFVAGVILFFLILCLTVLAGKNRKPETGNRKNSGDQ